MNWLKFKEIEMNWIDKQLAKSGPKRSQNKHVDALKCDSSVYLVFLTKTTLSRQNYKKKNWPYNPANIFPRSRLVYLPAKLWNIWPTCPRKMEALAYLILAQPQEKNRIDRYDSGSLVNDLTPSPPPLEFSRRTDQNTSIIGLCGGQRNNLYQTSSFFRDECTSIACE